MPYSFCGMDALTTAQAADSLGVTAERVRQLIRAGRLPAEKVGRDFLIKKKDLVQVKDRKPGRPPRSGG